MLAEIEQDKRNAINKLKEGLISSSADDIIEVLINLEDGTCDYMELIPTLEVIARVDGFCYFDDNGAGGQPHPDLRKKTSFGPWALKAIENIKVNALLESSSLIHMALKSNSTSLIKTTLENLKSENKSADQSLIPILEKIARKDVYKNYSYLSGFGANCPLGELAQAVIQIILRNSGGAIDTSSSRPDAYARPCAVCCSLPDDITVNTGREESFPNAYNQLVGMDTDYRPEYLRCPGCHTYYNWIDMPQMYGSGNNDEERLVRIAPAKSRLLDKLFSPDSTDLPTPAEVEEYIAILPPELLLPALNFRRQRTPEVMTRFVPHLIRLLVKNNDYPLSGLLDSYATHQAHGAEEILDAFRSTGEHSPNRFIQLLRHCLRIVKDKK